MENGDKALLLELERRTITNHGKITDIYNIIKGTGVNDVGMVGAIDRLGGAVNKMTMLLDKLDARVSHDHDTLILVDRMAKGIGRSLDRRNGKSWAIYTLAIGAIFSSVASWIFHA
jgi:hypothetical protein